MSYNFKNLADVDLLESVPEGATVFAEVGGTVKRVPGEGLGGSGSGKNLIIVGSSFEEYVSSIGSAARAAAMAADAPAVTYSANMSFEDALAAVRACELTGAYLYAVLDFPGCFSCITVEATSDFSVDCLAFMAYVGPSPSIMLFWTADGISTTEPSTGEQES